MQLVILSEIEKRTKLDVPIRSYFDLIIGTRYDCFFRSRVLV
jgi:hypothetical protein